MPVPENIFRYECRLPPRTDRPVLVLLITFVNFYLSRLIIFKNL
jgi:hypothetical protein